MAAPELPREQYIVDAEGRRIAVIIDIDVYEEMLEELEQLEDLRALEAARAVPGEDQDADEFFEELDRERGWRTACDDARREGGEPRPAEEVFAEIERERGWSIP
jgi:hypothetical protein